MLKVTKVFLPVLALSFLAGCSSDSAEEILQDVLNKDSVVLSNLDQHDITYENTVGGATHTDRYCPSGDLRDGNNAANGNWSVAGSILTTNPTNGGTAYNYTTTGSLEKNQIYNTDKVDSFKVIKIAETVCL